MQSKLCPQAKLKHWPLHGAEVLPTRTPGDLLDLYSFFRSFPLMYTHREVDSSLRLDDFFLFFFFSSQTNSKSLEIEEFLNFCFCLSCSLKFGYPLGQAKPLSLPDQGVKVLNATNQQPRATFYQFLNCRSLLLLFPWSVFLIHVNACEK